MRAGRAAKSFLFLSTPAGLADGLIGLGPWKQVRWYVDDPVSEQVWGMLAHTLFSEVFGEPVWAASRNEAMRRAMQERLAMEAGR